MILLNFYFSLFSSNATIDLIEESTLARKPAKNNFSNDGSFFENFKRITEAAAKKAQEEKEQKEKEELEARKARGEIVDNSEENGSNESDEANNEADDTEINNQNTQNQNANKKRDFNRASFESHNKPYPKHRYSGSVNQLPPLMGSPVMPPSSFNSTNMHLVPPPPIPPSNIMAMSNFPTGPHMAPFMQAPPPPFHLPPPPPPPQTSAAAFQTMSGKQTNIYSTQNQKSMPIGSIPAPRDLDLTVIPEPKMNVETIQVPENSTEAELPAFENSEGTVTYLKIRGE